MRDLHPELSGLQLRHTRLDLAAKPDAARAIELHFRTGRWTGGKRIADQQWSVQGTSDGVARIAPLHGNIPTEEAEARNTGTGFVHRFALRRRTLRCGTGLA
jgi:hypothetical protein